MRAIMRGLRLGSMWSVQNARQFLMPKIFFKTPNITLQPSLKSRPDQSRLHTSRMLEVSRFSSRLNSVVRRGLRERAMVLVMEAIFYKADISNLDLAIGWMKRNILMNELFFGTAKNAVNFYLWFWLTTNEWQYVMKADSYFYIIHKLFLHP